MNAAPRKTLYAFVAAIRSGETEETLVSNRIGLWLKVDGGSDNSGSQSRGSSVLAWSAKVGSQSNRILRYGNALPLQAPAGYSRAGMLSRSFVERHMNIEYEHPPTNRFVDTLRDVEDNDLRFAPLYNQSS